MGSNYRLTFHVDIVFCIDATESMDPVLDSVKNNALNFYRDFQQVMEQKHKRVDQLRVRVVVFRDYLADGRQAMLVTNFFTLPDQSSELETCLRSIEAKGGGDDPEDGLEALAYQGLTQGVVGSVPLEEPLSANWCNYLRQLA